MSSQYEDRHGDVQNNPEDRLEDVPSARDLALIAHYKELNNEPAAQEIGEELQERYSRCELMREEGSDILEAAGYAANLSPRYEDTKEIIGREYAIRHPDYVHKDNRFQLTDFNFLRSENRNRVKNRMSRFGRSVSEITFDSEQADTERESEDVQLLDPSELVGSKVERRESPPGMYQRASPGFVELSVTTAEASMTSMGIMYGYRNGGGSMEAATVGGVLGYLCGRAVYAGIREEEEPLLYHLVAKDGAGRKLGSEAKKTFSEVKEVLSGRQK